MTLFSAALTVMTTAAATAAVFVGLGTDNIATMAGGLTVVVALLGYLALDSLRQ